MAPWPVPLIVSFIYRFCLVVTQPHIILLNIISIIVKTNSQAVFIMNIGFAVYI